jgi:hypothetical protein
MKLISIALVILASLAFVGSANATSGSDHYCGQTKTSWDTWGANKATSCAFVRSTYNAVRSYQESDGGISSNEEFSVLVKSKGKTYTLRCDAFATDNYASVQCNGPKYRAYFVWS